MTNMKVVDSYQNPGHHALLRGKRKKRKRGKKKKRSLTTVQLNIFLFCFHKRTICATGWGRVRKQTEKKNVCVVLGHSLTKDLKWNAKGKPVV